MAGERDIAAELAATREQWETLAEHDPMWAVLTRPENTGRRWSEEEFFATGRREVQKVLDHVRALGLRLEPQGAALDFGCGVGRLTQALAEHFTHVVGIDISRRMVEEATRRNRFGDAVSYLASESERLPFDDGGFAFSYSSIVLQHVPPAAIPVYISELVRVTRGVAVFNVPDPGVAFEPNLAGLHRLFVVLRMRVGLRTRARRLLGRAPSRPEPPMLMGGLAERAVRSVVAARGEVRDVTWTTSSSLDEAGELRLGVRPREPLAGKQYTVVVR